MFNKWFKPSIPILRINSGIDHNSAKLVEESLKPLPRMKALAVVINSTGGMLVQGEIMKKKIIQAINLDNVSINADKVTNENQNLNSGSYNNQILRYDIFLFLFIFKLIIEF